MIKFFCDVCQEEMTEENMCSSQDPHRTRWVNYDPENERKIMYFTLHLDGKHNGNEVCINCAKRIINNA